ncbi:MAG: hypothetical protein ACKPJF_27965, partial [Dolichospermum sp.]
CSLRKSARQSVTDPETQCVSGSVTLCLADLRSEHDTQARAKLSDVVAPPATTISGNKLGYAGSK